MTRVLRVSDGKIFSSPRGVALAVGKPIARDVYFCCKRYIPEVDGETYEWVYDDSEDRGRKDFAESYWERRGKWVIRTYVLEWRAKFIQAWLDRIDDPHRWRRSAELAAEVCDAAKQLDETYKWEPNATSISKHLHAYEKFYAEAFGMQEKYITVPNYRGKIYKFVPKKAIVDFAKILHNLGENKNYGAGKPIIRLNDNAWFRSMTQAEELTQVPYYQLFHCCEGDIDYCEVPLTGEKMEFRYATEIDNK